MLTKKISQTLSLRLSLMVVCVIALLLLVSMAAMYFFSRQALREEALCNAQETLESTVQDVDNILLSVEQSTGNIYWDLLGHLNEPENMIKYSKRVVECNPYIIGCAIVFKPYYYPERELFMAYIHRKGHEPTTDEASEFIIQDTFTDKPYTEQVWYTEPMATGQPFWTDPLKNDNTEDEALTTFCLPIYDLSGKCVGVLAADVSIKLLSDIVLAAKPSANGYAAMLARNGSYIVHPNQEKLTKGNAFSLLEKNSDPALKKIIKAMLNEESGNQNFNMDGRGWYVVYKPFQRSVVDGRAMESLNWSIALVYPEDDIFEGNNQLLYLVITIIVIGLLVFSVLCRMVIHSQLLPLSMLTQWAQHFTKGHFDNIVPDTDREDEIGRLQRNFQKMQLSLTTQIKELERLTNQLNERGEVLQQANDKTQEADIMKTTFLHHMTKRLLEPTDTIDKSVTELCNRYQDISSEEAAKKIELIHQNSETVIGLINDMLQTAESETGKEGSHAQD